MNETPTPGSTWLHRNGIAYTVLFIANHATDRPALYPQMVVYQGANGNIWARRLDDWHRSMTKKENAMTEEQQLHEAEARVAVLKAALTLLEALNRLTDQVVVLIEQAKKEAALDKERPS